ncbi:polysaccharide pyruvyl transferase family protein [Pseudoxanthomonas sp. SE1]|uniref:polysaccharide pyruvyl transferase family protein n=1 Tax=Pseudoxanthomonas sp. SE1 TaxID=1664560 RepID=UPI00240DA3DB|nr:polysaccharide pyruvyl transferase family protein [Pseudoxanthomonas sp. SE1]WFC41509.1 polysaccharide pyruvyl transferase family protein [Pseudoxanthomonas sp. SE1]
MTSLRTAFTGYYGMRNFGDDLFGVLCARAARAYWHAVPRVVGPPLAAAPARSTVPRRYPANWYGGTGLVGKASRWLSFARGLHDCDVLVMGGGSVITARESFRKPMMLSAVERGVQLAAVGVSIGPFESARDEDSVAGFLQRFRYLSVRDERSHRLAKKMGLDAITHAGCDLAALLPPVGSSMDDDEPEKAAGAPVRIGVAPCRYPEHGEYAAPLRRRWEEHLIATLAGLRRFRDVIVDVFSLNEHPRHGDRALAQRLVERLRSEGVPAEWHAYASQDPLRTVGALAACDVVVSARLHGAIVAYLQDVPFMIIDYHPKCRDFADDIGLHASLRVTAADTDNPFSDALPALLAGERRPGVSRTAYARRAADIFQCAPWAQA